MIPVSQVITRVRVRYEAEAGGSTVRFSDENLLEFINEGVETLAEATGFYERYCTIQMRVGATYYDLRGFAPETVIGVSSVWNTARNQWLEPISRLRLDRYWRRATGSPLAYWTQGVYWLGIYPFPSSTTATNDLQQFLRVYFKAIPPRFTNTQGVLYDLPDHFYPALEDYVLYEMAAADGNSSRALVHWKSYQEREEGLSSFVQKRAQTSRAGALGYMAGRF